MLASTAPRHTPRRDCRLDCCNAVLTGTAKGEMKRLQVVQNAAARLLSGAWRRDHDIVTLRLRILHWLPVGQRVGFKTAVLIWKCIHGVAPICLQELWCTQVDSIRGRPRLRSTSTGCIQLPRLQTQRSFTYNGPAVWNSLLVPLRDSSVSQHSFRKRLKTYPLAA